MKKYQDLEKQLPLPSAEQQQEQSAPNQPLLQTVKICKGKDSENKEITYYADVETCKHLFEIVRNFFSFNLASKIYSYFGQLLEKIGNFSNSESIYKTQTTKLNNSSDLERKQISNSLIVMNQQYERRINVMQTYFIASTYK
jgi:hypothetical protein